MSKLLIVDDEIDIREFARHFFQKRGVQVYTACTGKEALELIEIEKPDLVLLDIRMGEMTGVEVLEELQNRDCQSKIIMVSGMEDDEVVQKCQSLGVVAFIHKPLILEELQKIVMGELE